MRLIPLAALISVAGGCVLYDSIEPNPPADMTGCVPSPSCLLDGGADMPVVLDAGDDGMCTMMCPADMGGDMARECEDSSTCRESAPVCSAVKRCEPCSSPNDAGTSTECAMHHSPKTLCGPSGACVECLSKDDCAATNRSCNLAMHACAPCQKHDDCTTGACKSGGICASPSEVAYVNNTNSATVTCSDLPHTSTPTAPYCQIQAAVSPSPKPFIVVAGSATPYNPVSLNTTLLGGIGPVVIIGPGRSASQLATVAGSGAVTPNAFALLTGSGNAATVTLDGLALTGDGGATPGAGARCTVGSGAATLSIRHSLIRNSGQAGVDSSGCTLILDGNVIGPANAGGGIVLGASTSFTVTNNIIAGNGTGMSGVDIANTATGTFAFNTVANNGGAGTGSPPGGITCGLGAAKSILHSIVVGNRLTTAGGTQFAGNCALTNVVTGPDSFTGANMLVPDLDATFHLNANATNRACCINQVPSPSPAIMNQDHDVDRETRPRGVSPTPYDTGADEAE